MLKRIMEEFLQIEGVTAAALIARDGFLIECAGIMPCDKDELAVLTCSAMDFFCRAAHTLEMGTARQFVLEHEDGTIVVTQVSGSELIAVITRAPSSLGRLSYILPKISTRVAAII